MLNPQIIEKMNLLKTALEANPEFMQNLKNTANEPSVEDAHPLIAFAQQNGIELSVEEIQAFFEAINSPNQELDDSLLEMIAGGQVEWYEFWKGEWWETIGKAISPVGSKNHWGGVEKSSTLII